MLEFFARLLDPVGVPPRWQCGLWSSGLGWLHIVSDVAIFAAYFTIPVLLVVLVWRRRRDIPFNGVFLLFAAFIVACGSGHLIEASMFWNPVYRLSGLVKAVTAVVSWLTVLALVPALRKALTLRTPTQLEAEVALRTMELQESRELLERRVDERTEAYRQSNEDLERFAYVASHDLQEPLRMVSGYMELLEDEHVEQLDDDAREYVRYAADGARRMQVLLDDLLAYSRAQSRELVPEPIAAEEAFEAALDNLGLRISETSATITHDPLPVVSFDRTQLVQLFQNLVSNALRFAKAGEAPRVHVGAQRDGEDWVISVRDEGVGFDMKFKERVFDLFKRLHKRGAYEGTGIGLAICKKVVERHGGEIDVVTAPGEGTTFRVRLPRVMEGAGE